MNDRSYVQPKPGSPELILQKLGFFIHPILIMIGLLGSPFVVFYPVCRRHSDADSCRYYRDNVYYAFMVLFAVLLLRITYRRNIAPVIYSRPEQRGLEGEKGALELDASG